jgi:hypothetical protein
LRSAALALKIVCETPLLRGVTLRLTIEDERDKWVVFDENLRRMSFHESREAAVEWVRQKRGARGSKNPEKAARRKRQQLVKELNAEPSATDAMRHRLPGSFETGKRR